MTLPSALPCEQANRARRLTPDSCRHAHLPPLMCCRRLSALRIRAVHACYRCSAIRHRKLLHQCLRARGPQLNTKPIVAKCFCAGIKATAPPSLSTSVPSCFIPYNIYYISLMDPYQVPVRRSDTPVQQIIKDRYIDPSRLETLLSQKFPPGTYSITVGWLHPCYIPKSGTSN